MLVEVGDGRASLEGEPDEARIKPSSPFRHLPVYVTAVVETNKGLASDVGRTLGARPRRHAATILSVAASTVLSGCSVLSQGFLAPAGPVAAAQRHEFLIICAIMILVIGPVFLLTPLVAWHYRLANTKSAFRPDWGFSWLLEGLIWIPPTLIVIALSIFLVRGTMRLDPYRPIPASMPPLQVEAVSLDWKWLFIYPEQHVASVNRLVLPVSQPVHMSLTSGTVMQSLLMPNIAGQIYAMAGMTTQLNLMVSISGRYWGENTQFSGSGFEKEKFQVLGVDEADFSQWVAGAQHTPRQLDDLAYQGLSTQSVVQQPITFGGVEPALFNKIVQQAIPSARTGAPSKQMGER